MSVWHFYQGLRGEWNWYRFDEEGELLTASDDVFSELTACMENARDFGFSEGHYQVHTRDGAGVTQYPLASAAEQHESHASVDELRAGSES